MKSLITSRRFCFAPFFENLSPEPFLNFRPVVCPFSESHIGVVLWGFSASRGFSRGAAMQLASLSHHGKSRAALRAALSTILISAGILVAAIPVSADPATLHCGPNDDRVWLYDSLVSFNVVARLTCGDSVEVLGRAPGYVKVRSSAGQEGYVPLNALPQLPPPADSSLSADGSPRQLTLAEAAALARHRNTAAVAAASAPAPAPVRAQAPALAIQPAVQPAVEVVVSPPPSRPAAQPVAPPVATSPMVAPVALATPHQPAVAVTVPKPAPVAPAPPAVIAPQPPAPEVHTSVSVAANVSPSAPAVSVASAAPPAEAEPEIDLTSAPEPSPAVAASPDPAPSPTPSPSPAPDRDPFVSNPAAALVHNSSRTAPADLDDDDDASDTRPPAVNVSSCAAYFSAYGLSPNQYKWIETNRKKYPGICPAPTPALVDFVVIFTHDVNFYNFTMPAPVRTDSNGLSDWTPLRTEDSALVPVSEMDKNHREYVWVFHTRRGAFNPARFSSKRHPLYEKSESNMFGSHAGDRTAEDALHFIAENQGTN